MRVVTSAPTRFILFMAVALLGFQPSYGLTLSELRADPSQLANASGADVQKLIGSVKSSSLSDKFKRSLESKLNNFSKAKSRLDDCFKGEDSRSLRRDIVTGMLADPCISGAAGGPSIPDTLEDISKIVQATSFAGVKGFIADRTAKDVARTVFDYRTQFESAPKLPDPNNEREMSQYARTVCPGCSDAHKAQLKKALADQITANKGAAPAQTFSVDDVVLQMNKTVEGLNYQIDEMVKAKNDKDEAAFERAYEHYLTSYQMFTSTQVGAVFMTDSVRDQVGKVLTPDQIQEKFYFFGKMTAPEHRSLKEDPPCAKRSAAVACIQPNKQMMTRALQEIQSQVGKHTKAVLEADSFEDLLKVHPAMVGKLLVLNPELIGPVCDAITKITTRDTATANAISYAENAATVIDTASLGLMVVGGLGFGTKLLAGTVRATARLGAGAVARNVASSSGRATLAQAASGSQTGAVAARVTRKTMEVAAKTGAASEVLHGAVDGGNMYRVSGQQEMLMAGRMARARDSVDMKRIAELEEKWNGSMSNLLGASALNSMPLAGALMKVRVGKIMGAGKNLSDELAADATLQDMVAKMGKGALQKLDGLIQSRKWKPDAVAATLAYLSSHAQAQAAKLVEIVQKSGGEIPPELVAAFANPEMAECAK